jgi:Tfp pilus assembly protein PilW
MSYLLRQQTGAMLIEHLVSLLLGLFVIAAVYSFSRAQIYQALVQESKTATLEDARGALDMIVSDLKNAGAWRNETAPNETGAGDDPDNDADEVCNRVYAATANKLHLQMDLNGNGNCADTNPRENIRYELSGPTSTCRGSKILRRNGDCLVADVAAPAQGKLFRYFDASGADLGGTPPLALIRRISVGFAVRAKNPDPRSSSNISSELSTSVVLRN